MQINASDRAPERPKILPAPGKGEWRWGGKAVHARTGKENKIKQNNARCRYRIPLISIRTLHYHHHHLHHHHSAWWSSSSLRWVLEGVEELGKRRCISLGQAGTGHTHTATPREERDGITKQSRDLSTLLRHLGPTNNRCCNRNKIWNN